MKNKQSKPSSLSQRGLLVQVNISQWAARKLDKEATATVIKAHKTDATAGGYNKRLLPNAKELQDVNQHASQIRKYFYEQTLPWMSDGSRIISAKNILKFRTTIKKMQTEFEGAVNDFEAAYPRLQAQAQKTLGGLYNPEEYPAHSHVKEKFKCEVISYPLPDVNDFRVEVTETEKKQFIHKMKEVEAAAMREVWERFHGVVKAAAEKLSAPDAIFRDSLMENMKEMCSILPALNISEDPKIDAMKKEVEKLIGSYSVENLREDKGERSKAAKKLKEVQDKMAAFAGAYK